MGIDALSAIIGVISTAVIAIIPYLVARKNTKAEQATAIQSIVEASQSLYKGLQDRVDRLEKENENLRKQIDMMKHSNAYISDLEQAKYTLDEKVTILNGRISLLENTFSVIINKMYEYLDQPPTKESNAYIRKLLKDIERQTRNENSAEQSFPE